MAEDSIRNILKEDNNLRIILYLGIFLIISGVAIIFISDFIFNFSGYSYFFNLLAPLICGAGISLIIMATIEAINWRRSLKSTADEIVKKSNDELKLMFSFLKRREDNGLENILSPRLMGPDTKKIIADEIMKSKNVKIFCMTGLDFFGAFRGTAESGVCYNAIFRKINNEKNRFGINIKALLLEPGCEAATFRSSIEILGTARENIEEDIKAAMIGINNLNAQARGFTEKNFIEPRFYDIYPQAYFVITDNCIFIEQYHFAPTDKFCEVLEEKGLMENAKISPSTGGRVPILQYNAHSTMYVAMDLHFDAIWEKAKKAG